MLRCKTQAALVGDQAAEAVAEKHDPGLFKCGKFTMQSLSNVAHRHREGFSMTWSPARVTDAVNIDTARELLSQRPIAVRVATGVGKNHKGDITRLRFGPQRPQILLHKVIQRPGYSFSITTGKRFLKRPNP